ncbi:MAG: S-layer homology domain-containing protein [Flavonifractor plautii]
MTDGSVGVDDLLNPSSYSPKIVKSGTLSLTGSSQPGSVKISGLTSDGSYYLSAVFVDAREERSPLKVISFTTPDNTVPNFASGYPYMSKITSTSGQVTTMATKSCRLYWAVLPKGASAPTANDFKANAVSGNLGFGTLDVTKNVSNTFDVNNVPLEELESYDLYLWLTDVDGGQSSAVKKVSFTTVDGTPPRFNTNPTVNKVNATSVGLYANLNEAGTLYWVVVKEGEEYPKPLAGQSGKVDLSSDNAKLQVSAGMNALKNGKVTMTEGKDVSFTVSGLEKETAYDLYYVAQDKAGNYSETVGKITIHTLDPNAPTVTQEFTKYNGTDSTTPLPNTDVRLVFSEGIQDAGTNQNLYELYQKVAAGTEPKSKLAGLLRDSIKLYQDTGNGPATQVVDYKDDKDNWTINYENVVIKQEDGKTVVVFPGSGGSADAALNLQSGATYYFEIEAGKIADTSESKNVMGKVTLDKFTTVFAQVNISTVNQAEITVGSGPDNKKTVNAVWKLDPVTTDKVGDFIDWDMLIWTDTNLSFNLYRSTGGGPWEQLNKKGEVTITLSSATEGFLGVSLTKDFLKVGETMTDFDPLNELKEGQTYEYAMEFTSVNGERDKQAWNGRVNIRVNVVAGKDNDLRMMATSVTEQNWMDTVVNGDLTDIGLPKDFTLKVPFSDQSIPEFTSGYPKFTPGATDAQMELLLNRPGTVYYVVAPKGDILTTDKDGKNYKDEPHYSSLPTEGDNTITMPSFNQPQVMDILNPEKSYSKNPSIKYDNTACQSSVVKLSVEDLSPQTDYIVYFVIQNTAQNYSEVQCYRFTTTDVGTPYITLNNQSPDVQFKTSESSELNYVLVAYNQIPDFLKGKFATEANMDQEDLKKFQSSGLNQNMTILEALIETVRQGSGNEGPSVFDMYAKASLRDRVGKLIRRNQSGDSMTTVASGPISLEKNVPQVKQFEQYMNMNTLYYCLAVARNKDGTEDGFKAIGGVNIPDNDPPVLSVTGGQAIPTDKGWSGTVTLTFSENLYWLSEDRQTLKEVWTKEPVNATQGQKAVYILDEAFGIGGSAAKKLKLEDGAFASPSGTFTFKYEGVVEGDTLVFFRTGYASDMNMNGRGMEAKTKTILTYVTGTGTTNFLTNGHFVITQGAIEGDSPTT